MPVFLLLLTLVSGTLGFGVATVTWVRRWRGIWRGLALVPVGGMAFLILRIVVDCWANPTSHNLWPIEVLIWGGCALAALLSVDEQETRQAPVPG